MRCRCIRQSERCASLWCTTSAPGCRCTRSTEGRSARGAQKNFGAMGADPSVEEDRSALPRSEAGLFSGGRAEPSGTFSRKRRRMGRCRRICKIQVAGRLCHLTRACSDRSALVYWSSSSCSRWSGPVRASIFFPSAPLASSSLRSSTRSTTATKTSDADRSLARRRRGRRRPVAPNSRTRSRRPRHVCAPHPRHLPPRMPAASRRETGRRGAFLARGLGAAT